MKRIKIVSYDTTSISAKAIARFRKGKNRIRPEGNFRGQYGDTIINWGFRGNISSSVIGDATLLNKPENVGLASNKIKCLTLLEDNGVPTLEFYTNKDELLEAFHGDAGFGTKVYCRQRISSHSGRGIVIATKPDEVVDANLYTVEFENDREYRVHIFNGKIIDIQQKRRMSSERRERLGLGDVVNDVRNKDNGWSFVRNNVIFKNNDDEFINDLFTTSMNAINVLGLDFGAIDLLYNSENDEAVVCEVNTAAGQKVGTTTNYRYIKAIEEFVGNDISIDIYNRRWGSEINDFNNGMDEFLNNFI